MELDLHRQLTEFTRREDRSISAITRRMIRMVWRLLKERMRSGSSRWQR